MRKLVFKSETQSIKMKALLLAAMVAKCLLGRVDGLVPLFAVRGAGGRAPTQPDMPSLDVDDLPNKSWLSPNKTPTEARLTIVQITDVYTLENFPSLKTLLRKIRASQQSDGHGGSVISILTGDFLSPYLLSSVDRGAGMMKALAKTPIDYLTWGNHEADIDHRSVCRHVKSFPGTWLNTNMQDHEAMEYQKPYDIVEVCSADGSNKRRIGLVAVLSNDPDLYSHFKAPGAFGGATIEDPWETLRKYKKILEEEEGCDVVIPLQHLYVPEDHQTCRLFDFPLILSGHDHHRVDEVINGTRLVKAGSDAVFCAVTEIGWSDSKQERNKPSIRNTFVRVDEWEADEELKRETDKAYDVLLPLRNTELARVPPTFEPLSSKNARGSVCTMGKMICSLLKSSLNTSRRQRVHHVDAVLLMGGNIRGGEDYPPGSFFSMEALEAEIKSDEVIGITQMPGRVLAEGIEATHAGDPIPGWMQYDDGIKEEVGEDGLTRVTMAAGEPLDPDRMYQVATKISDLTNGQSPPLTEYYTKFPAFLPSKGSYVNIQSELMSFFSRNLWRKLWEATYLRASGVVNDTLDSSADSLCSTDVEECNPEGRLATLDRDGDGIVTIDDIHVGLHNFLGLSVDEEEKTLAEYVHSFADTTGNGRVTLEDFECFCVEMPQVYENQKWRLAFPRPRPVLPEEMRPQEVL